MHCVAFFQDNMTYDIDRVKGIQDRFWHKENGDILFIIIYKLRREPTGQLTQAWKHTLDELDVNGVRMVKHGLRTDSNSTLELTSL